MKLTPRSQNHRYRRSNWPETRYIDITKVGKGSAKCVEGIDQDGRPVVFGSDEYDSDWVRMGSTVKMKRQRQPKD